ncbi:hypothetical protein GCM10009530_08810 [Microbispora corallina]|uniref:Uncharacterized protein n=1 Tax=Microbispora corallina TaxID=83302 RepID=A0ABQ4FVJ0_9ACTN|nr:hypothetical protein Mco01_18440 [Microbispora corallina]
MIYPAGVDANSQGAAELLTVLMRTAARFTEMGRSLSQDHFPHVRSRAVSDLAGSVARLGAELELPGHELVFEVNVGLADGAFTVRGDLVLDGEETYLDLPLVETPDVRRLAELLDRYVDELTVPARRHVGDLLEDCGPEL